MKTSATGRAHIKLWESCRLTAYLDRKRGVWTIGWGHTGPEVREGLAWSQALADDTFERDLMRFEGYITALVNTPLTQAQFDALVSLIYNIGYSAFYNSTIRRLLNMREYGAASAQFKRWIYDDGVVVQGLVNRRLAEETMFLQGALPWTPRPPSSTPTSPSRTSPSVSPKPSATLSPLLRFWHSLLSFIRSGFSTWRS